ncbi:MAG: NUDIX hydrolase [Spirochaetales bacterium]|nr:NUDIX hydrolase [Spirochaetales bacterium]
MKLYVTKYRGAGLALVTKDKKGIQRVLLGRRLIGPGKHTWSFPGGKRHAGETAASNALREANEELELWNGAPAWPGVAAIQEICSCPFYDWTTYCWKVENPSLRMPQQGRDLEFEAWGWFELNHLPYPLHYGVGPVIRRLRHRQD